MSDERDPDELPPGVLARMRIVWSPEELEAQRVWEAEQAAKLEPDAELESDE